MAITTYCTWKQCIHRYENRILLFQQVYLIASSNQIRHTYLKSWYKSVFVASLHITKMIKFGIFIKQYKAIHYVDIIMSAMASQITSLIIVYSTVYSGAELRKHQSAASLAFGWGIHRWPVNFLHKGPVTWNMFLFDDVIMKSWNCEISTGYSKKIMCISIVHRWKAGLGGWVIISDVTWGPCHLKSPTIQLFAQQLVQFFNKANIKYLHYRHFMMGMHRGNGEFS